MRRAAAFGLLLLVLLVVALVRGARSHPHQRPPVPVSQSPDTTSRARGIALVRQAQAQAERGAHGDAIGLYRQAIRHLPELADWLHLFTASAAASAGDSLAADAELARVDSAVRADWGWRARVRARRTADNPRGALLIADSVAGAHATLSYRAEASAAAAELRLQLGDSAGAYPALRRALELAPGSEGAARAAAILAALPRTTSADRRRIGDVRLRHGQLDAALASYRLYLRGPAPPLAERLRILEATGRALFAAGRYREAEDRLLSYARSARASERAAAALYTAARAQYRTGRRPVAIGTLRRLIETYPRTEAAAEAAFLLGDLAHDEANLQEARRRFRQATTLAPATEPAGLARMRLGGIAFAAGQYQPALREYQAYLQAFPTGLRAQQARYWAALSLLELGRTAEARRLLREIRETEPLSYYSVLAAEQLGEAFAALPLRASPAALPAQARETARALDRLRLLRELGWNEAAAFELRLARHRVQDRPAASYALAEGLGELGFASTAITMAWDLHRRAGAWNLRLLRILYPFPYRHTILAEATARGVDPFLAAALIRQESSFDAGAVSGAGAIGLMQVMPATGRMLAPALGIRQFRPELLREPTTNIRIGMTFLAEQLRTWNGRTAPVLAAYNAGPARVERWSSFPEWGRDELFTERIPFRETRDYVKAVLRNAAVYRALYATLPPESPSAFD